MNSDGSWFNHSGGRLIRPRSISWLWYPYGGAGIFRSADLNAVGWLVVLGPGVVLGVGVSFATGWPWWFTTIVGALCSWLAALTIDAVAWRRSPVGIGISNLTRTEADAVLARLQTQGVELSLHEDADSESGDVLVSFQSTNRFVGAIQREAEAERRRGED